MTDSVVRYMLTTIDNPFSPHTQFDEWYAYDERLGHCSSALLARVVNTSDELSEIDQILAIHQGIDEILEHDVTGYYRKIAPTDEIRVVE